MTRPTENPSVLPTVSASSTAVLPFAVTPLINQPEVAILGVSRGAIEPVWQDGQFVPRQMLPLSLSYDHRVIDGADAIRFLRWVVEAIEQPFLLSLLG